jgi:2-(1,2-epoxy-1,2-dihydrophenyl)acetyl-CoA isomerase
MSDLLETRDGGVLRLVFNRPERKNALTPDMLDHLIDALRRAALDPEVRCILLTGAGGAFCAGGDVKAFAERGGANAEATPEQSVANLRARMEASRLLHEIAKPTIAAISGAAAGAGLSLALACDLRIAADSAKITTAFAKVGLSGDFGGTYFLSHLIGAGRARELYLCSPILDGKAAERLGIVNRVVPETELEEAALAWAKELASGPTVTYGYIKKNFNRAETATLSEALDGEALHHSLCAATHDHREGSKAFVEKRKPVYKGA